MQQHQHFSILELIQDDQYFLLREDVIHQKVHPFTFVYHDRFVFVNIIQIRLYVKFLYGVCYGGNLCGA